MGRPRTRTDAQRRAAPFGLRIKPVARKRLAAAAKRHRRSLHAEILARLDESLEAAKGPS